MFLLFVGYRIWCVVFHRMSAPRSKVDGEMLVHGLFVGVMRDLRKGEKKVLGEGRISIPNNEES